ncbi:MAG: of bacteriophage-type DNA polymerase [Candidatus Xenolissoclinum pacificiensis L6]|uniref:Type-4 uracil-DNA glycosylase n=1 Tax=Candidatus Xenolissoclinum pacificiensis L6 TaxID=1401685 RepID=W2V0F4_9RICK|nr:MAG: of bacteriophage-type DNA polymerase [Candidatus Xenolissoclinum pacificiensis L6]
MDFMDIQYTSTKTIEPINLQNKVPDTNNIDKEHSRIADHMNLSSICNIQQLHKKINNLTDCDLKKKSLNTVIFDGNIESDIMIIGEAPGEQEDKQGRPFCGQSGKLLDKMFSAIDLSRNQMYITNTVFWRPPGNRKPTPDEINICLPFVKKSIALINPRLLILVGGVASGAILQTHTAISKVRGKYYKYTNEYMNNDIDTTVIFHPAYLLRQPAQKKVTWEDMKNIKNFLQNT